MVKFKLESGGFLIENKILFGASVANEDYINLWLEIWEDMVNEKLPYSMVEFPGEYDIDWIFIKVVPAKDWKLNYLINMKNKKIGIIQSPKILEEDEVTGMDFWLYLDDSVEKKLDQLELEWKKYKLSWDGNTLDVDMKDDDEHQEVEIKVSNTQWQDPEVDLE